MAEADLSGVAVVGAGSFNPAIVHPRWLAEKGLLPSSLAEYAESPDSPQQLVVSPQLTVFLADWLIVQITQDQAIFSTVDLGRELELRDFAAGIFELLPETPVDAIGINLDTHFKAGSEKAWHTFGDKFLPKDFWEPLFDDEGAWLARPDGKRVGMRSMTVEVHRTSSDFPGHVRVEVAPSVRISPNGIYVGINNHFQLAKPGERSTAAKAADVLRDEWSETKRTGSKLVAGLLEAV